MRDKVAVVVLSAILFALAATAQASESPSGKNIKARLSTDEVENQISLDRKANPLYESKLLAPLRTWRDGVAEKTGFNWSIDYSALFMGVNDSPGEDSASGGMVRFIAAVMPWCMSQPP